MENALVIIHAEDIPAAEEIAKSLAEYTVYTCDPILIDKIAASSLNNAELFTCGNCPEYSHLDRWSHSAAYALEKKIDVAVQVLAPEVSLSSWQHLNHYYLFMSIGWYASLWDEFLKGKETKKIHVLICDNPAHYYWPSFVPALLLMEKMKAKGVAFNAFVYGKRQDDTDVIPDFRLDGENPVRHDIVAHLPTCMYDHAYFNQELKASGNGILNVRSKYWDTPVDATATIGLVRIKDVSSNLPAGLQERHDTIAACILDSLIILLKPYIGSHDYLTRQSAYIVSLYKSQLITHFMLEEYFKEQKPSKLLISDHDFGFHGPLYSFVKNHQIPVVIIPHSKIIHTMEFGCDNSIALTHPIQGESFSDCNSRRVRSFDLAFPENFSGSTAFPERVRRIGLLLNALSLEGVLFCAHSLYVAGIVKIDQWCRQHGVELSIRCRPGHSLMKILEDEIGIHPNSLRAALSVPLVDYAKGVDLCLMYGTPTTGALEFLKQSIPILNPVPKGLSRLEGCFANTRVVPRGSVENILDTLDTFTADTSNFFLFRTNQFNNYVSSFSDARPLRDFL